MANVDSKLHDSGDAKDRESENPKRGLRGAAGGIYVGPTRPNAADTNTAHATGAAAGGVEDSTGYRKRDKYEAMGATPLGSSHTRPTGRTASIGDGVQGGSVPGDPVVSASIDNRAVTDGTGGRALGMDGRGTQYYAVGRDSISSADPIGTGVVASATYDKNPRVSGNPIIPQPTLGTSANPSAGTVALIQGALKLQADLHVDDVTSGANGLAGCVIYLYTRGTDTDDDDVFVGKFDFDSATAADAFTGLTASTTYAFYARFKDAAGNVGPLSARSTVATS